MVCTVHSILSEKLIKYWHSFTVDYWSIESVIHCRLFRNNARYTKISLKSIAICFDEKTQASMLTVISLFALTQRIAWVFQSFFS